MEGIPIKNLLSRGQLKLFVYAMLLARAQLLQDSLGVKAIFLIDDLTAELDNRASQLLLGSLAAFGGQVILTTVDLSSVQAVNHQAPAFHISAGALVNEGMFHVEHEGASSNMFV
jgi:DNA replication and repair protein RecF